MRARAAPRPAMRTAASRGAPVARPRPTLTRSRAEPPPASSERREGGVRILICEDNALIAMMLESLVEDLGHLCVGRAIDKPGALALAAEAAPDAALVDIDLADGMTGCEVVESLAARGVASVIVSGRDEALPSSARFAAARLSKPVNEALLAQALSSLAHPLETDDS